MISLHALLLGIIEGITEFLPISSTGHLILAEKLLAVPPSPLTTSFTVAIQFGAILAVLVLYGQRLLLSHTLLLRLIAAFLPTALCGSILYGIVKVLFLQSVPIVLWSMFLGGIVLLLFELVVLSRAPHPNPLPRGEGISNLDTITYRQALGIGLIQSLAMIPGVSRSAVSIIGGLALGLPRQSAVAFSFLLAIPTMIAATSLDLAKNGAAFSEHDWLALLIGTVASFLTALTALRWFLRYLEHHTFIPFGLYRIVAAPVFWFLLS